jgi:hypothetical protein
MAEDLALASTWNPRGEATRLAAMWDRICSVYSSVSIVVPPEAPCAELEQETRVPGECFHPAPDWKLGRHLALQRAADNEAPAIQYLDMDHLLRWIETYDGEWRDIASRAARSKFLVIGRTPRAYSTHPMAIRETEAPINRLFSRVFGRPMDVCVGARGMTREVTRFVLQEGKATEAFCVDTEWPAIAYSHGVALDYVEAEGLDWESADRHQSSAASAERQLRLAAQYDQDPSNWAYRRKSARAMIRSGVAALRRLRAAREQDLPD